jgi:hypothetical protein
MKPLPVTVWLLGFGGVIPFLLLFVALLLDFEPPSGIEIDVASWLLAYAAVIVSFLGAVHWGVALAMQEALSRGQLEQHFFYGVTPALLAWFVLLLPQPLAFFVMAALVMLAYGFDAMLLFRRLDSDYNVLRLYLTSAVTLLLIASGLTLTLEIGP